MSESKPILLDVSNGVATITFNRPQAKNSLDVEALSEKDLLVLRQHFHELAKLSRGERDTTQSHSIDEARSRHEFKRRDRSER